MVITIPSGLTITKLPVLQIHEEVKILNCYSCFLFPLTGGCKYKQRMGQKGEEKKGKRRGVRIQLTFWHAVRWGGAHSQSTAGMPKGRRETPQGLSGKSMPEFHHSNCRESMA